MSAASSSNASTTSSAIAIRTVIGMVLGVLGLFALVISYQFLPRRQKPLSALGALAPPPPKSKPFLVKLRAHCTTLLDRLMQKPTTLTPDHDTRRPSTHRTLRSFHLSRERRRQREALRQKFSSTLRLDLNLQHRFRANKNQDSPKMTPFPYERMKDDVESQMTLLKPDMAVISPWSPSEEFYPHTPPPKFAASSGPTTPPPAYAPNTPLRGNFHHAGAVTSTTTEHRERQQAAQSVSSPEHRMSDDVQSLIAEVQAVIEYTREWAHQVSSDPFVIGDEDDVDSDCDWDAHASV
ncbi:hypothetical protein BC835DRAFT_1412667 [Cytidiella melzeri]|nr:hypothetical protein BC835DRAFT_1412667 [Cytidiella melzeri]